MFNETPFMVEKNSGPKVIKKSNAQLRWAWILNAQKYKIIKIIKKNQLFQMQINLQCYFSCS